MSLNYKNLDYKKIIGLIALVFIGGWMLTKKESIQKESKSELVTLNAERIKKGDMSEKRVFPGVLKAEKSVSITTERSVTIKNIQKDGSVIKKGELIMELYDSTEKNAVLSAEAVMLEQKSQFKRAEELFKEGIISESELHSKESGYKKADADYQRSISELEKMKFKAPFDGILGLIKYNEGAVLPYNQEAAMFISDGPLLVHFSVSESNANEIHKDLELDVYRDSPNSLPNSAVVIAYEPQADLTHSIAIKARLSNSNEKLIPGQFVRVHVPLGIKRGVIMAPEAAVRTNHGSSYVFKVENNKANYSPVKIGIRDDGYVEIVDGLSENDIVIIEAGDSLSDGLKVKPNIIGEHTVNSGEAS